MRWISPHFVVPFFWQVLQWPHPVWKQFINGKHGNQKVGLWSSRMFTVRRRILTTFSIKFLKKIVLGQQVQELCHNRCQSMSLTQNSLGVQWPEPHFSGQCYRNPTHWWVYWNERLWIRRQFMCFSYVADIHKITVEFHRCQLSVL